MLRQDLNALGAANTAGELRQAVERMCALPGMGRMVVPENEGLLAAVREQRALVRSQDIDGETGLANRKRFTRALRERRRDPACATAPAAVLVIRLAPDTELRTLIRAGHVCASALRTGDLAARVGTRRVGLLLRDISPSDALAVAARVHTTLAGLQPSAAKVSMVIRVLAHGTAALAPN